MSNDLAFAPMPQPWGIVEALGPDGRPLRLLRIGAKEVAIADIESVAVEPVTARDTLGLRVMTIAFGTAALVFLVGVAQFGWLPRFLIGAAFLFALALLSVSDILGLRAITYTRLHIRTRRGATLLFASADLIQISALATAIGLDLPPESLRGTGIKNRATGALLME